MKQNISYQQHKIENDDSMDNDSKETNFIHLIGQTKQISKLYDMSIKVLTDTLDDLPNRISIYSKISIFDKYLIIY